MYNSTILILLNLKKKMQNKTTLQNTVTQQRQELKNLLFESMSEVAEACAKQINNREALEIIQIGRAHV